MARLVIYRVSIIWAKQHVLAVYMLILSILIVVYCEIFWLWLNLTNVKGYSQNILDTEYNTMDLEVYG